MADTATELFKTRVLGEIGLNNIFEVKTSIPAKIEKHLSEQVGRDLLHGFNITKFNKVSNTHEVVRMVKGILDGRKTSYTCLGDISWSLYKDQWYGFIERAVGYDVVNSDGKWVKRVENALRKQYGIKLTGEQKEHAGNVIANCGQKLDVMTISVDITNNLDWACGEYFDGDGRSCFWGGYTPSRWAMDDDERFYALRFYENGKGSGRAWVCADDKGLVLFNSSHPSYDSIMFGEVLSVILDSGNIVPKKVRVHNPTGDFYVNSGSGIMLTDKEHIVDDFRLDLNTNQYHCHRCSALRRKKEMVNYKRKNYCNSCYDYLFAKCSCCEKQCGKDNLKKTARGRSLCKDCYKENYFVCVSCDKLHLKKNVVKSGRQSYCKKCHKANFKECPECKELAHVRSFRRTVDYKNICLKCIEKYQCCAACNEFFLTEELHHNLDRRYSCCKECRDRLFTYCDRCEEYFLNQMQDENRSCSRCVEAPPSGTIYDVTDYAGGDTATRYTTSSATYSG